MTIKEIAADLGFSEQFAFRKYFKTSLMDGDGYSIYDYVDYRRALLSETVVPTMPPNPSAHTAIPWPATKKYPTPPPSP